MGGAPREYYVKVVRSALQVIEDASADYVVIGGVATKALLDMPLDEDEDVDVLIREVDADRLLEIFSDLGYSTYRRDERWIYKAAQPDVTIDLIFLAGEVIRLDEEHLARATSADLDGLNLRVPAPEDLAVMKAVFDQHDRPGRWYGALKILRSRPIDWDYLAERGAAYAPARILSLLLYARDDGIEVPDPPLSRLAAAALG